MDKLKLQIASPDKSKIIINIRDGELEILKDGEQLLNITGNNEVRVRDFSKSALKSFGRMFKLIRRTNEV
jgi:hypothetical protein